MRKINTNIIQGYKEKEIPFSLYTDENKSSSLAIFLPGAGYSVQRPLFHYATKIFSNRKFDILHINYQYNDPFYNGFSYKELAEAVKYDVRTVIDKVLEDVPYENYYLVGKSIGTIAMISELKREIFKNAKAVWLTPLLHNDGVFNAIISSENSGLCYIGDNDYCYIEDRYKQLLNNPNIVSTLIPNVDHALEYIHNTTESIEVLKNIMKDIEKF